MQTNFADTSVSTSVSQSAVSNDTINSQTSLRQTSFAGIISQSQELQKVFGIVEKVAKTNSTVLVHGESGTGKELIARAIHRLSARTGKLVPVNCGAIPEELLESELFGHEKGAFTGATQSRMGRFQMADGGTIFLDEIGEMSPKLQVKLLRVLQERKVEPVGSTRTIDVNVRVIAATNKSLIDEVKAGRFREDLFYRLQVVPIGLPPLRDRGEDVLILARYFLERACESMSRPLMNITPAAQAVLMAFNWPGNIRELENVVERLAILVDGDTLDLMDLPEYMHARSGSCSVVETPSYIPADGLDFNTLVSQFETKLITMALDKTKGNKKAAARLLHLNRTTLVEKIKKKEIEGVLTAPSAGDDDIRAGI
jgi:transcriptional regulator with GAF, ATPase, and Fis domain